MMNTSPGLGTSELCDHESKMTEGRVLTLQTSWERADEQLVAADSSTTENEMDPLTQAREAIGEVHLILKQFGINLEGSSQNVVEIPRSPESLEETQEISVGIEAPEVTKHKQNKHLRGRNIFQNHLHVPKLKLKRSEWAVSHSLTHSLSLPRHSKLLTRVSSVFKRYRSEADAGNVYSNTSNEVKLKSALKKADPSCSDRRSETLVVHFGHVVVVDGAGREKFYELATEKTAQSLRLRHGFEVDAIASSQMSEHQHYMYSSAKVEGKGFTRSSESNGIFIQAR